MLKKLKFIKINPAGNITLLYFNENIDENDIRKISKISMNELNLYAEQVGFIRERHLQMMGGEFCGNACRSFASLLAFKDIKFKKKKNYKITCSGESAILEVDVRVSGIKNIFLAKIKMPKKISMEIINLNNKENETFTFYEIVFSGITHFIVKIPIRDEIMDIVRDYSKKKNYPAFGVMFFDYKTMSMIPYVEVQGFEGVWENSCASGTTAIGYYLNKYRNIYIEKIYQPSGWLEVSIKNDDVFIDGPVEIIAEGIHYVNYPPLKI